MRLRRLIAGLGLAVIGAGSAGAAGLPASKVEYSATRVVESEQGSFSGKVHHSAGKERAEMDMGGMKMITIVRPDKQLVWTLMPNEKMYMEMDMRAAQQSGMHSDPTQDVTITELGKETVEGHATTKYKMVMKDNSAAGFVWLTKDNIPVQMEMLSGQGGEKTRVKISLKDLQLGKQSGALFEVPGGYQKMPGMGFNPGAQGR